MKEASATAKVMLLSLDSAFEGAFGALGRAWAAPRARRVASETRNFEPRAMGDRGAAGRLAANTCS